MTHYLNFARVLHPRTAGQLLGPDLSGHMWLASEVLPRDDGKPGSRLRVRQLRLGES